MPPTQLELIARSICTHSGLTYVGPVGAGAFKETFQASTAAGDPLALKIHRPGVVSERAGRELEAMKACSHPNIGRLLDASIYDLGGIKYLVSTEEYLPGGTLGSLIARGRMPRAELLALGTQLIAAVGHVYEVRLVHRDIKPENVMMRADGRTPVLVDFGLVRCLDQSSLTETWLSQGPGTPLYAPAEQLTNDKAGIDWRADQFPLGVTLSFAAFGFHPYSEVDGDNLAAVQRVAARRPQSARFATAAAKLGLPELVRMTAPWPIHRHRLPGHLAAAWSAQ